MELAKEQWLKLQCHYSAGMVRAIDGYCCSHIISEHPPAIPGARAIEPGLEEAYLYWLQRYQSGKVFLPNMPGQAKE